MNFKIIALVVTYKRTLLLEKLLRSINSQNIKFDFVYIVDNENSTLNEELITSINSNFIYLNPKNNLGCAGGFSFGLKHITNIHNDGWIVFLDDDISLKPTFITVLLEKGYLAKDCCIIPSKIYANGDFFFWSPILTTNKLFVKHNIENSSCGLSTETLQVENITFESCILPIGLIRKIGFPNPDFFIDGDDYEYGLRIAKHIPIIKIPEILVERLIVITPVIKTRVIFGISFKSRRSPISAWRLYYEVRNKYLVSKTLGISKLYTFLSITPHYLRIFFGLLIFKELSLKQICKVAFKANFDGIFNKFGQRDF